MSKVRNSKHKNFYTLANVIYYSASSQKNYQINASLLSEKFLFSQARSQKTDPSWTFTVLFTKKKVQNKNF